MTYLTKPGEQLGIVKLLINQCNGPECKFSACSSFKFIQQQAQGKFYLPINFDKLTLCTQYRQEGRVAGVQSRGPFTVTARQKYY